MIKTKEPSVYNGPMDIYISAFNCRDKDRQRADLGFKRRFGCKAFEKFIKPIHDAGIMSMFQSKPNRHTRWYAETLAFCVNERNKAVPVANR